MLILGAVLPGVGELAENALHIVVQGHLAHADDQGHDDLHETPGPEHGCAGPFHSCVCCQTVPATVEANLAAVGVAEPPRHFTFRRAEISVDPIVYPIEHPPRA
jgi:hypothetical protein